MANRNPHITASDKAEAVDLWMVTLPENEKNIIESYLRAIKGSIRNIGEMGAREIIYELVLAERANRQKNK